MTLRELKDSIAFEAQIPDIDALGGWVEQAAKPLLDSYTALLKYPELKVSNFEITPTGYTIALPTNLQHLDKKTVRYLPEGELDRSYLLTERNGPVTEDDGPTKYFYYDTLGVGAPYIRYWPYHSIQPNDRIIIDYWRKATEWTGNNSLILPDSLAETLKQELIARATLLGGNKAFGPHRQLAKDAHVRSFGMTDVGTMNG